jgi:hypothetical protein
MSEPLGQPVDLPRTIEVQGYLYVDCLHSLFSKVPEEYLHRRERAGKGSTK